jgi:acyl carrier protein
MIDRLITVVVRSAQDVVEREGIELREELGPDTPLFGRNGVFDSLGLVSLIVGVEEVLSDQFGASVSLADERAMSQANSPFRTIRSLAEYAAGQLEPSDAQTD